MKPVHRDTVRRSVLDMPADEFRALGHALVDRIADFYATLPTRTVMPREGSDAAAGLAGGSRLPDQGTDAAELLDEVVPQIIDASLHNGHPGFMGYITSSAAPVGALAELLAAAVNANLAKRELSPIASDIESQVVSWLADLVGYRKDCGGLLVSGGNMANLHGFVAARRAQAPWNIRADGLYGDARRLTAYVSAEAHTWIDKAADVCGLGADGIRWIATDPDGRMRVDELRSRIEADRRAGRLPFLVVGTAGSVSTGVVDPLEELAAVCAEQDLWFHVDGAYGAPAALSPEAPRDLRALGLADSIALDPHKWLYCPIEAGCVLTRDQRVLRDAFSFSPSYYDFGKLKDNEPDLHELGLQNTRGFRALKVWLALRLAGREGYRESIRGDMRLAGELFRLVDAHPEFQANAVNLSIVTFRYVPRDLDADGDRETQAYLDELNRALLARIQASGRFFLSNAVVNGRYMLRACIVNFRTSERDIAELPETIARLARPLDAGRRPGALPQRNP